MLVSQESIILRVIKDGLVENSVFKVEGVSAVLAISEKYSLILERFTNNYGCKIHKLHMSDFDTYVIADIVEFTKVINLLDSFLSNANYAEADKQTILGSFKRVLYDDLLKIHQEEYIQELLASK